MSDSKHLFHGTGLYCLAAIVESNKLFEGGYWGKPGEPHGPRFSEDVKIAGEFAIYNAYYAEGGVLVLDREKLAQDFELVAYIDEVSGTKHKWEREIAAITPVIEDVNVYLRGILVEPAFIEAMKSDEFIEIAWSEGGWPSDFRKTKKERSGCEKY